MPIDTEGVEIVLQKKQPPPTIPPTPTPSSMYMNPEPTVAPSTSLYPPEPTPSQMFMNPQPKPTPVAEYVEKGNVATLIKNLEGFATEEQQQVYDAQAVQRAANAVPSPTLIKNVEAFAVEGQQNLLDLQAKEFAESDYGKLLEANLGAKRMYESALAAGRPPPTFSLITPTIITQQTQMQEQKPTLQEAYQQYHDVRMPGLLIAESETATPILPTYETIQIRTTPKAGMLGGFQTYEVKVVDVERLAEQTRLVSEWETQWSKVEAEARQKFELDLTKINGSSEWMSEQRAVFGVYVQTQRQQQFAQFASELIPYMKQWQPMGLAERLANWTVTPQIVTSPQGMLFGTLAGKPVEATPAAGIAGLIAPFERLTYSALNLAGIGTPRPPPTVIGGVVSKGVGIVLGKPSDELERAVQNPLYAIGSIGGEIALGLGIGKVASTVWEGLPSAITGPFERVASKVGGATVGKVQEKATDYLTTQYQKAAETGNVLAWKGFKESLVMRLTQTTPRLAIGEVSIPVAETAQGIIPQGIPYTDIGWSLTEAPKMGGVMFTKIPTAGAEYAKYLPVMFGLGEELIPFSQIQAEEKLGFSGGKPAAELKPYEAVQSIGSFDKGPSYSLEALRRQPTVLPTVKELMMRESYMPFTTQSMLTRMGIQPYIAPSVGVGAVGAEVSGGMLLIAPPIFSKPTLDVKPSTFTFQIQPPKLEPSTLIIPSALPSFTTTVVKPSEQKSRFIETSLPSTSGIVEPLSRQTLTLELSQKPSLKLAQTPEVFGDLTQQQLSKQGLFQLEASKSETKQKMVVPSLFQGVTDLLYQQNLEASKPALTMGARVLPALVPIVSPKFDLPQPSPMKPSFSGPSIPTPKLFDLPKSGGGGTGPREPMNLLYPFGRQKRKYPVMTGGQVAKFLFSGKTETKKRKKK